MDEALLQFLGRLVTTIKDASEPEAIRAQAIYTLRHILMRQREGESEQRIQNFVAHHNAIGPLIQLACAPHETATRSAALTCLTELSFDNLQISVALGESPELVECCERILSTHNPALWMDAADVLGNIAGFCWDTHRYTLRCVRPITALLMHDGTPREVVEQCIRFVVTHSYNPESRAPLIAAGAVEALVKHSKSLGPYSMSAYIGLACLFDGHDHPSLNAPEICTQLVEALVSALEGKDFPLNSGLYFTDWRLMLGISNLCGCSVRQALVEAKLVDVLRKILNTRDDKRLVESTLTALWRVSFA